MCINALIIKKKKKVVRPKIAKLENRKGKEDSAPEGPRKEERSSPSQKKKKEKDEQKDKEWKKVVRPRRNGEKNEVVRCRKMKEGRRKKVRSRGASEDEGFEPPSGCPRRFSRPLDYHYPSPPKKSFKYSSVQHGAASRKNSIAS